MLRVDDDDDGDDDVCSDVLRVGMWHAKANGQ